MKCEPAQGLLPDGVFRIPSTNAQVIDRYGLSLESFRRIRRVFYRRTEPGSRHYFIYRLKIYNRIKCQIIFPQASPESPNQPQVEIVKLSLLQTGPEYPRQFADPPYPDNIKATPGMQEVSARRPAERCPKFQSKRNYSKLFFVSSRNVFPFQAAYPTNHL